MKPSKSLCAALVALHSLSLAAPVAWAADSEGAAVRRQRIRRVRRGLEQLVARLPRERFDLDGLATTLEYAPEKLLAFVRDEVAYEPYPGALRGPRGTLWARAGNALDQAWLAAELLRRAGYDARMVRVRLEPGQADALLAQARRPRRPRPQAALEAAVKEFASLVGVDLEAPKLEAAAAAATREAARAGERVEGAAAKLRGVVAPALAGGATPAPWRAEAQDYVWVQHRLAPGDPWQDAHPCFEAPPASFAQLEATPLAGLGPGEDRLHFVELRAYLERRSQGRDEVVPLMDPWRRPAHELAGGSWPLVLEPDALRGVEDAQDLAATMARTTRLRLTMAGAPPPGGKVFDLGGRFVASSPTAQEALGKLSGGGLAGALGGGGAGGEAPSGPASEIVRVWVEVEATGPGGARLHRRHLLDRRRGDALEAMSAEQVAEALTSELRLVADLGAVPDEWWMARKARAASEAYAVAERLHADSGEAAGPLRADIARVAAAAPVPRVAELLKAFHALDGADGVRRFRAGPGLFLLVGRVHGGKTQAALDILQNPRRALRTDTGAPAPEAVLAAGVADTAWEVAALGEGADGAFPRLADAPADELTLVRSVAGLASSGLDAPAQAFARRDLDAGFVLAVRPAAEGRGAAWWRVDPSTGETLGILEDGTGGSITEYSDTLISIAGGMVSIAFHYQGVQSCETVCCQVANLGLAISAALFGFGAGAALVKQFGEKAAVKIAGWMFFGHDLVLGAAYANALNLKC